MSGLSLPTVAVRRQVASAITVVIQVSRLSDGKRKVTSISEITGMEGDIITMQEIFTFKKKGISLDGRGPRRLYANRVRPKFAEQLITAGIPLPATMFKG